MSALTEKTDLLKTTKNRIKSELETLTGSPISSNIFSTYASKLNEFSIHGKMRQPPVGRCCTEGITEFICPNTKNITNFMYFFQNGIGQLPTIDLSNVDVSRGQNLALMFAYAPYLKELDLSKFNLRAVKTMHAMFQNDKLLSNLILPHCDAPNLVDLSDMFYGCDSLERVDLTSINLPNAKIHNLGGLFCYAQKITYADISNIKFDVNQQCNIDYIIFDNPLLTTVKWPAKMYSKNSTSKIKYTGCPKLTKQTLLDLFNALQKPNTTKTLVLDRIHQSKFSITELNILKNKGWLIEWK